jgi:hypothetical protein
MNCKRERQEENTVDVKLSAELRELLGGRRHVKEEELTRAVLLEWAKRQGAGKEVNLISITVQTMGVTELKVRLDDTANSVHCLKQNIQDGMVFLYSVSICFWCRRRAAIKLK